MTYDNAKDLYIELKNFEGKATFKGEDTVIDLFVLLPKSGEESIDVEKLLETHRSTEGFELEGKHSGDYTIAAINIAAKKHSTDMDYFMSLLVW